MTTKPIETKPALTPPEVDPNDFTDEELMAAGKMKAAVDPADSEIVTYTVARGRSIASDYVAQPYWDQARGVMVESRTPTNHKHGHRNKAPDTIELPRAEGRRLIALGFLVDPDAKPVDIDDGQAQAFERMVSRSGAAA